MQKCPIFQLFSFCNPSHYRKHAPNLNANGVNLNVIIKDEYSLIFLHIVRNFAFMSDFRKLRQFLLIFVTLSFLSHCVRMFFVGMVLTKHSDLLSEFLFALFLSLMFEYLLEYLL